MAYSQDEIDALRAAIATGALEVQFGAGPDSRRVRYRSLAEMQQTLAIMESQAGTARISYAEHCRD